MNKPTITTHFLSQFRQGDFDIPGGREKQYGNFVFNHFISSEAEIGVLGKWFNHNISDADSILDVFSKLENENKPLLKKLSSLVKGMLVTFSSYAMAEPCTAHYYNSILAVVRPFSEFINSFLEDGRDNLFYKIKGLFKNKKSATENDTSYENISDLEAKLGQDIKRMATYYDYFLLFLRKESGTGSISKVRLTTQVEEFLERSVSLLETIIINAQFIQANLEQREMQLEKQQRQELYN